ncbi:DNA replication complex GINS family protein [Candidatus Micrarchaeota archaeon]|nr:DNA replication complex GINS family protein [Candidatus Micrarchaeota archaeon]
MVGYSDLRDVQRKEMEFSGAVVLSDDFYESVADLLSKKNLTAFSSKSLLAIKEYENIKKIVLSIQTKREEKIVLMAVRGETAGTGLTKEEREMLKELSSILNKYRTSIKEAWDNDSAEINSRRIKLLQDIAQYKGLDNNLYGPFKSGDEANLPLSEVEWLLKSKMAENI